MSDRDSQSSRRLGRDASLRTQSVLVRHLRGLSSLAWVASATMHLSPDFLPDGGLLLPGLTVGAEPDLAENVVLRSRDCRCRSLMRDDGLGGPRRSWRRWPSLDFRSLRSISIFCFWRFRVGLTRRPASGFASASFCPRTVEDLFPESEFSCSGSSERLGVGRGLLRLLLGLLVRLDRRPTCALRFRLARGFLFFGLCHRSGRRCLRICRPSPSPSRILSSRRRIDVASGLDRACASLSDRTICWISLRRRTCEALRFTSHVDGVDLTKVFFATHAQILRALGAMDVGSCLRRCTQSRPDPADALISAGLARAAIRLKLRNGLLEVGFGLSLQSEIEATPSGLHTLLISGAQHSTCSGRRNPPA